MKKAIPVLLTAAALVSLASCSKEAPPAGPDAAPPAVSQGPDSSAPSSDASGLPPEEQGAAYTLYIGADGTFQEYPMTYEGELDDIGLIPPEAMLAAMSELTGWNLDLAGEITQGKGGMTVSFADTSALFTGPPEEQKDEFHMYDVRQLVSTVLDSIRQTFRQYYVNVEAGGDPESLDVYFCAADGGDLVIPGLELTVPMDRPYRGLDAG